MTEMTHQVTAEEAEHWHEFFGPTAFNRTWELLDRPELSSEEEEEMLATTFAQRYHWHEVGGPRNRAIADWQVSRVTAVLGYADLARRFGLRSLQLAEEHDLGAFVTGFAHEAIARAAADVDDLDTFTHHLDLAKALVSEIEDEEERETLEADLALMGES